MKQLVTKYNTSLIVASLTLLIILLYPDILYPSAIKNLSVPITGNWRFCMVGDTTWYPANVPGCIHNDLMNNGLISNPYISDNEITLQWIGKEDWIYEKNFTIDKEIIRKDRIELEFEGLDTYADIFLNDSLILSANNMFRQWKINCKNLIHEGKNTLRIYFHSTDKIAQELYARHLPHLPGGERVMVRKAQYQFGWDWGPRYVTAGIYRPITLRAWSGLRLIDSWIKTMTINSRAASLKAVLEIESCKEQRVRISIQLKEGGNYSLRATGNKKQESTDSTSGENPQKQILKINTTLLSIDISLHKGHNLIEIPFEIENPQLWWPNGYGEPFLYQIHVKIECNGETLDENTCKVSIREAKLVREKNSSGETFYFLINGIPLFAKGTNYIPQDIFPSRVTPEQYQRLIETAVSCNMNMLRVWGGGIYEREIFYDLCDENGILVWQDFMFACGMYPGSKSFIENVSSEVTEVVKRLRKHPSIALWCGNNEIEEGWFNWGWQRQHNYSEHDSLDIWIDYEKLFHKIIPSLINKYDGTRAYHPSSPRFGRASSKCLTEGDCHYWGVWHDLEPIHIYTKKVGRFMSEYGMQSMPDVATIIHYSKNSQYPPGATEILKHQKCPAGTEKLFSYLKEMFGLQGRSINSLLDTEQSRQSRHIETRSAAEPLSVSTPNGLSNQVSYETPDRLEALVYLSQLLQARATGTAIGAHRMAKPYCMGTLYWQFNDCWPAVSWSSMDWYGRWKALQYFTKRLFRDPAIFISEVNGKVNVSIINDAPDSLTAELVITLMSFSGNRLWEKRGNVSISPMSNSLSFSTDTGNLIGHNDKRGIVLVCTLKKDKEILSKALHYFAPIKEIKIKKPLIHINTTSGDSVITLDLSSNTLVKNVCIQCEGYGLRASDNFFDLLPGEARKITLHPFKRITGDQISIKVFSLYEALEAIR